MSRRLFLLGGLVLPALALSGIPLPGGSRVRAADPVRFEAETIRRMARELASRPYKPADRKLPAELDTMGYDSYRNIRFDPPRSIWRGQKLPFEMQLFHRGFLFKERVDVFIVVDGAVQRLVYEPEQFRFENNLRPPPDLQDIGHAGLRLHAPLNRSDYFDEVAVFQGASYFRALGKGQVHGTSSRGLSLKTADPGGEEFPVFKAFWVEQPKENVESIVVHALLDSPSASAAHRFTIRPGEMTVMSVEMAVYPRVDLDQAGISPLTSMFLFAPNDRDGIDDFRPAVHDAHGLQVATGKGERLWRPLINPRKLEITVLADTNLHGFGLMQRQRSFFDYQDMEARYEKRTSVWVEPIGDWGEGAVHLVEIPTAEEIHDNIVAFWRPKVTLRKGGEYTYNYRLHWGWNEPNPAPLGKIAATRLGGSKQRRLFVLDLTGEELRPVPVGDFKIDLTASAGALSSVVLQPHPEIGGLRLSFALDPKGATSIELRGTLLLRGRPASETWIYRWIA